MKKPAGRPRAAHGVALRLGALALVPIVLLGLFGSRLISSADP